MALQRQIPQVLLSVQRTGFNCGLSKFNYSSFKSSISLDKLYPGCDMNAISANPMPPRSADKFTGFIPMDKISISYSRGQGESLKKPSTKATVKFQVSDAFWIPEVVRKKFLNKFKNQITRDGTISIQSDRTSFRILNTADALQIVREMIRSCEGVPVEDTHTVLEKGRRLHEKAARQRLLVNNPSC